MSSVILNTTDHIRHKQISNYRIKSFPKLLYKTPKLITGPGWK